MFLEPLGVDPSTGPGRTDEHKMLIELACATTLSVAYDPDVFWRILDPESTLSPEEKRKKTVVFIACGGFNVTNSEIGSYQDLLEKAENDWEILCNGARIHYTK